MRHNQIPLSLLVWKICVIFQNKVSGRGWMEMLQISLYFYCHSDIEISSIYKNLWALWNSVFVLWLCKPTKTRLSTIISQLHGSVSEEGMANPRTFIVIADKEWNRQGYIEFLYLSPSFLTSCQRSLEKEKEQKRGVSLSLRENKLWGNLTHSEAVVCSKFINSC